MTVTIKGSKIKTVDLMEKELFLAEKELRTGFVLRCRNKTVRIILASKLQLKYLPFCDAVTFRSIVTHPLTRNSCRENSTPARDVSFTCICIIRIISTLYINHQPIIICRSCHGQFPFSTYFL